MLNIIPNEIPQGVLHQHLLGCVSPRPIAFASTVDEKGNPNIAPYSFFNCFSSNPPILVFSSNRKGTDNTTKDTLHNVVATGEVVINMVSHSIVRQMAVASIAFPKGVSEFEKSGLTPIPSDLVKPFRVKESPAQLECKVQQIISLGDEGGAGNLIICEVVKFHISKDVLDKDNNINQKKLDLVARAGGNFYSRANKGFFEVPKPLSALGIGVDNLPEEVRDSMVLTGNDLGMLANVEALPSKKMVNEFINSLGENHPNIKNVSHREKHKLARNYLSFGDVESAWKILLS